MLKTEEKIQFRNLQTGLPSLGVSGLPGLMGRSKSRVFYMSLDDLFISDNTGTTVEKRFNKNLKAGDIIYLYTNAKSVPQSIFDIAYPKYDGDPEDEEEFAAFIERLNTSKIAIISRIILTTDIMNMTYDEFRSIYYDSKDIPEYSLYEYTYDEDSKELYIYTALFGDAVKSDADYFTKLVKTDLFNSYKKSGLLNIISLSGDKELSITDTTVGDTLSIGPVISSENHKPLYLNADIYLTNKADLVNLYDKVEGYTVEYNKDLRVDGIISDKDNRAYLNLKSVKESTDKDTIFAYIDKEGNIVRKYISEVDDIFKGDTGDTFLFWLEKTDPDTMMEHTSGIYEFEEERIQDGEDPELYKSTYRITRLRGITEKKETVQLDMDSNNPYITVLYDKTYNFYKAGTKDDLDSLSKVNISVEKNYNKDRADRSNVISINGRYFSIYDTYEPDTLYTDGFNTEQIKAVKVIRNDENLFSVEVYISYSELEAVGAANISDFYSKAKESVETVPLIIDPFKISLDVFGTRFMYTIPGYHDYVLDTDYDIVPSITSFNSCEELNELNVKYVNPNALLVPFTVSLNALDIERLKTNNISSLDIDIVFNDFYPSAKDATADVPVYHSIVREPANMQAENIASIGKFDYVENIIYGILDDEQVEHVKSLEDKTALIEEGVLKIDTIDKPVIRAIHNRLTSLDEISDTPLTYTVSIDISGHDVSNKTIYDKTFFLYISQDNPMPAVINLYPHIAGLRYYAEGEDPMFEKALYKKTVHNNTASFECTYRLMENTTFVIYPLALTAIYKKQEDEENYMNMRIDNVTRRVVGPEDKIKISVYPLYDDIQPRKLYKSEFPHNQNTLYIKTERPVFKVIYNKYPLLPYNTEETEIVEYNEVQYPSLKYEQYNQNAPVFYGLNLGYDIFDKNVFEVKNKWLAEYEYLFDNNILTENLKDPLFDTMYRVTASNSALVLDDTADTGTIDKEITLGKVKSILNKDMFSKDIYMYLATELDKENKYYKTNNAIPEELFRAPLWEVEWSTPEKQSKYENRVYARPVDISNYADMFEMNIRTMEDNIPNSICVLSLRCPTIEEDSLDNRINYVNIEELEENDWAAKYIKYGDDPYNIALTQYAEHYLQPNQIYRYYNYYIETNNIERDTKDNFSSLEHTLYSKNIHRDIDGLLFDLFGLDEE